MDKKDIKAIREYLDKAEALEKNIPQRLTSEEWDEAFEEIMKTGKIPPKYKKRITESESEVLTGLEKVIDEDGNPVLNEDGTTKFRIIQYETPQKKIIYSDTVWEEWSNRRRSLDKEYQEPIAKALQAYFANNSDEENKGKWASNIVEIITQLLEDPAIRKEIEKELKAAQGNELAPLGSMPNGDALNWLYRVITSNKGGRLVQRSIGNRHEEIVATQKGDTLTFTRKNKQSGSTVIIEIDQANKYLRKTNKTFIKLLTFTLQKMTEQHFPLEVSFPLQELVDLGMYSTTSNARRAVKEFFEQQLLTTLSGIVKKGKKTVKEEGGVLFYHYRLKNGYVTLSANENFNMDFIANYFTVFPRFAYALSNNAFSLVRYIFFLARQNTQPIKDKGTFAINLEAVRENLGLPSIEEVNNRKYKQFIMDPIEMAIEEIENALINVPEAKEYGFTITPYTEDTGNINKWLEGYLEIGLNGDFAETFVRIATKAEKDREKWEKIKQEELARIAARAEAKEAQADTPNTQTKHKRN